MTIEGRPTNDAEFHMWTYWRNKYGYKNALRDYYGGAMAHDDRLKIALYQILAAEALIDQIMADRL